MHTIRHSLAAKQLALPAGGGLAGTGGRCCEGVVRVQFGNSDQGAGTRSFRAGLVGFEVDEEPEDVEQVDWGGGVVGGPKVEVAHRATGGLVPPGAVVSELNEPDCTIISPARCRRLGRRQRAGETGNLGVACSPLTIVPAGQAGR